MLKKIILLIVVSFMLVACGSVKIHDNVKEDIANDVIQIMDRVIYNVNKEIPIKEVNDKDDKLFERYTKKYIEDTDTTPTELEGVDRNYRPYVIAALIRYAKSAMLESDKEYMTDKQKFMNKFIETGKEAGE